MKLIYKIFTLIGILVNTSTINAQNSHIFSAGISIPDNISNKYLRTGIALAYGIDIKLYKNLSLNTGISVSFNNKNKSYTFGFDDDPFYHNLSYPYSIESFIRPSSYYDEMQVYLFNPSLNLNIKYFINIKNGFSLFLILGINGSYSFYIDQYEIVEFKPNDYGAFTIYGTGEPLTQKFNIAYNFGTGLCYTFKNGKSIFVEADYQIIPNIKLGRNNDRVGLFIIKSGISFPFK